jgi:hypothetical protein
MKQFVLAAIGAICVACATTDSVEPTPTEPPHCPAPSTCESDNDCFVDMCAESICVTGVCEHRPRP